jgi:phage shock protein A
MQNSTFPETEDVERLLSLQHGDRGFFVVALYAFIECYLRKRYALSYDEARFGDLVNRLVEDIQSERYVPKTEYNCLNALPQDIYNANKVRHNYEQISVEEVRASIYLFAAFARTVGIYRVGELSALDRNLEDWKDRKSARELSRELEKAAARITELTAANRNLSGGVEELSRLRDTLAHLEAENDRISRELTGYRGRSEDRDKKNQELRKKNYEDGERVRKEMASLRAKIAELADAREYLDALSRVTVYTRTRLDFEKSLVRLTAEQEKVLSQIRLNRDFLVKGSAGTGKSLVLIKALEKALAERDGKLGIDPPETMVLLTYTKSLVAYTRYVSSLLNIDDPGELICTADSFMIARFHELVPGGTVTFAFDDDLLSAFVPPDGSGLSPKDLYAEAESFIWANMITEEEYVGKVIARTGMKKPIREDARKGVWDAIERAGSTLRERNRWTRSLAALCVIERSEMIPDASRVDYVFIDEAQDLPAVMLAALKRAARRSVILAGDSDQAIYQNGFSFRRAGIDIAGRSRVLRTNFRNSIQLHDFAERYRKTIPGMDGENGSDAFRYGVPPELTRSSTTGELYERLFQKLQLCLKYLSYDSENICIIAPTKDHLDHVAAELKERFDLPAAIIKDDSFRFEDKGVVRLSTMHSSKGLDFPVVLFLLDHRPRLATIYDDDAVERMTRNLVYVSITRAMEQLHVFTLESTGSKAILDLEEAFKEG